MNSVPSCIAVIVLASLAAVGSGVADSGTEQAGLGARADENAGDGPTRADGDPPEGTPGDQLLWRELDRGAASAVAILGRLSQCSYRIRYGRHYEQLDALAASADATVASRAAGRRARLAEAAAAVERALPPDGGRVRACRYTLLHFGQRMPLSDDPTYGKELPAYREQARDCRDRMDALVATLGPHADALEAALADADAFLITSVNANQGANSSPNAAANPRSGAIRDAKETTR